MVTHPKSGPHSMVTTHTEWGRRRKLWLFAYLPSFLLAGSSLLLLRLPVLAVGWCLWNCSVDWRPADLWDSRTGLGLPGHLVWGTKQPAPWPFCREAVTAWLPGPQTVSPSKKPYIHTFSFDQFCSCKEPKLIPFPMEYSPSSSEHV